MMKQQQQPDNQRKAMFANMSGKRRIIFATGGIGSKWHIDPAYSDIMKVSPLQKNVERYLRQIRQVKYNDMAVGNIFKTQVMKDYPMPEDWQQVFKMAERIINVDTNPKRQIELKKMSELRQKLNTQLGNQSSSVARFSKLPISMQDKFPFKIDLMRP